MTGSGITYEILHPLPIREMVQIPHRTSSKTSEMALSSNHTTEEAAEAYAGLQLRPHEKTSPMAVPRSAHTHASQQAVNVPSP
jgi:hypothetical protein